MSSNIVVGLPSGQIINCNSDCKYSLYSLNLAKYLSYYNDDFFGEYAFLDKDVRKIKRIIKRSISLDTKVHHEQYGNGKVAGIFGDDGWIVKFENIEKKMYVDKSMLLQDLRFKLL